VPPDVDAALLVAVQSDWKKKLITRPHLEPALPPSTIANPTFIITVLAVNGADYDDAAYEETQNTAEEITAAVDRVLPNQISYAAKPNATCFAPLPGVMDHTTAAPETGWLFKHNVAGVRGSSGGALLDAANNLIGIEVGSEAVDGKVTPNCAKYGITWRGRLREFALDHILSTKFGHEGQPSSQNRVGESVGTLILEIKIEDRASLGYGWVQNRDGSMPAEPLCCCDFFCFFFFIFFFILRMGNGGRDFCSELFSFLFFF
jgi:hypothetical protein